MKIVYIAHPIAGDQRGNMDKVIAIVAEINRKLPHIVPFAPYIVDLCGADDDDPKSRERGFMNNRAFFDKGCIDEVWCFGDSITPGMRKEIEWAINANIPVFKRKAIYQIRFEDFIPINEINAKP